MTRHLPRRYQLIRQTSTRPDLALGIVAHVVEFPDGSCVSRAISPPLTTLWESLDDVKSHGVLVEATVERID
jgi:hypothetical protein